MFVKESERKMNPKDKNADWLKKPFQGREPVAWALFRDGVFVDAIHPDEHKRFEGGYTTALFLTPQYRELSDEEMEKMFFKFCESSGTKRDFKRLVDEYLKKASEK